MSIAIDCEMVGVGQNQSHVARVSLVDENGSKLLDTYIKPNVPVSDYRTAISGITAADLRNGRSLSDVQKEVIRIISGRDLVGHSVDKDVEALGLSHPQSKIKDIAQYRYFQYNGQPRSLKDLANTHLGRSIQVGSHDSVQDAKAAMDLYKYARQRGWNN